ncbi:cell division topological specificity factor MinE [Megalodesulfovibrio gigas]|uniref:Cell division topological specificity factor n=1 Tax=Megalodesulfovibrio gigas (strain ATCC 19364 / DSM 1382 / NCIMB 9332 / VKM B-1759) TaxID=1121448 RepID=T2GFG1_MEGG1|nr:cell division topological specificity factor MinE [Megalodesulfovibrio gigas]AGW14871.1 putative cell division topological specificity factor MinE [Megalodesulfovibrio gigas DSM 1382 = ATCC 19364]
MGIFDFLRPRKNSACVAKERLQIIVAHQRALNSGHDYLPVLQKELLDVIRRYIPVTEDQVKIELDRQGDCHVLELNVTLPDKNDRGATGGSDRG